MKEIQLTRGMVAMVDDEDFERLNGFNWNAWTRKGSRIFYARARIDGKVRYMHRVITGHPLGMVDHVDGNGLNNQKWNLRLCSQRLNSMNQRKQLNRSSIFKGVCWDNFTSNWKASVGVDGKILHLGRFDDEVDAARTYNTAAKHHFGAFAHLNDTGKTDV